MDKRYLQAFLNYDQPSYILTTLYHAGELDPEILELKHTPQNLTHHPEGDVFIHTCMVVDFAAEISNRERLDEFSNAVLRLAALCHDFGKPATTEILNDGRITAYDHPNAGVSPTRRFLERNKINPQVIDAVIPLVKEHMAHVGFYTPDITTRVVKRLMLRLQPTNIHMLGYVVEADHSGRGGHYYGQGLPERMAGIIHVAETINTMIYPDPIVSGDDIMAALGISPSRELGQIKDMLYKAQLEGKFNDRDSGLAYMHAHVRKV